MPATFDPSTDPLGAAMSMPYVPDAASDPLGAAMSLPAGKLIPSENPEASGLSPEHHLKNRLRQQRTWEEVAPELKSAGVDPEAYRQDYQLAEAHAVQKGEGLGYESSVLPRWMTATAEQATRQGLQFISPAVRQKHAQEYTDALEKFKDRKATQEEIGTIARYERLQGIDREIGSSFGGKLVQALGGAGEILGEAQVGGAIGSKVPGGFLARQAAATPFMPSLYQQHAAETNIQEGRSASDVRALPTAMGLAYANNLVLGQLQGISKALPGGLVARSAGAGIIGTGEQAGVDVAAGLADEFLPKAFQTRTKYGTIGMLAGLGQEANAGEAAQHAAIQALTFSVFAGLHGGDPHAAIEAYKGQADKLHDAGLTKEQADKVLVENGQQMQQVLDIDPKAEVSYDPPKIAETRTRVERRRDTLRAEMDTWTPEQRYERIFISKVPGLENRTAFDVMESKEKAPLLVMSDADGLKALNDTYGYDAGNALLKAKTAALQKVGLDSYHDKGDEFLHRGESDPAELRAKMDEARKILRESPITFTDPKTGQERTFKGADFSFGIGKDLKVAEAGMHEHKAEREAKGERARGELRGIAEVPTASAQAAEPNVTAQLHLPESPAPLDGVSDVQTKKIASNLGQTVVGLRKRQAEPGIREGIAREKAKLGIIAPESPPAAPAPPPTQSPAQAEIVDPGASGGQKDSAVRPQTPGGKSATPTTAEVRQAILMGGKEPPVPPGKVRLYRTEGSHPDDVGQSGDLWTPHRDFSEDYGDRTWYVDVPDTGETGSVMQAPGGMREMGAKLLSPGWHDLGATEKQRQKVFDHIEDEKYTEAARVHSGPAARFIARGRAGTAEAQARAPEVGENNPIGENSHLGVVPGEESLRPAAGDPQAVFDAAGLSRGEQHVVRELLGGRSLMDVAADPAMAKLYGRAPSHATIANILERAGGKLGQAPKEMRATLDRVLGEARADRAIDAAERGQAVSPADLHADPEVVHQRIGEKLTRREKVQEGIKGLTDKWIKENDNGRLSPEREAEFRAEATRLAEELAAVGRGEQAQDQPAENIPGPSREAPAPEAAKPAKTAKLTPLSPEQRKNAQRVSMLKARLASAEQTGNDWLKAELQAELDGTETAASWARGQGGIDPKSLDPDQVANLKQSGAGSILTDSREAKIGAKGRNAIDTMAEEAIRQGIIPEKASEHGTEQLIQAILENRPVRDSGKAGDRMVAEHDAKEQAAEGQRRADLTDEQRAAEDAAKHDQAELDKERPLDAEFDQHLPGEKEMDLGGAMFGGFPFPSATRLMDAMAKAVFGRGRGKDPDFKPDADPNPDNPKALPDYDVAKRAAFNQLGARNTNRPEIASTAWAWMRHVGDQLANAWRIKMGTRPDPFKDMPKSDLIEAEMKSPGSQNFTPEQQAALTLWRGVWEKQLRAMDAAGVKFRDADGHIRPVDQMLKEGYFHRATADPTAVGEAWEKLFGGPGHGTSSKPGIKPGYRKARAYDTEAEGVAAGVKYKSFFDSIHDFIQSSNREIADHRYANDPLLGGRDLVEPRRRQLFAANKPVLDALPAAERAKLEQQLVMLASQSATGNVQVAPAFKGKEYSPEVKRHIEAMHGERGGPILKVAGAVSQEVRNLVLGGDMSYALLQMQGMLFSNPVRWARTMARGVESIFRPEVLSKIVERPEYRQAMDEITQAGGSAGKMPEQIGTAGKSLISKAPLIGPVYDRLNRAMSTTLDLAKLELWRANRPDNPKEWPRAVEALENSLGQGRMEQLGMTPERAFLERLFVLAPSYYRAHAKLLEQATQRGSPGFIARKQLGALASGVMLTSIAALYALKQSGQITDEEMEERLNPARGKFLMVPVPLGHSGKTAEIGFGGLYISIARTIGNAKRYAEGQASENPYIHWYRGHSGVLIRTAWDVATGKDYMGKPVGTGEAIGKSMLPVAVQQGITGEGTPEQRAADVGAGLVGLRSYPGSDTGNYFDKLRQLAQSEYGKRYEELSIPEQARVVKRLGVTDEKPPSTPGAKQKAIEADELRVQRLTKGVSEDTRSKLKDLGKELPSYDAKLSVNGVGVPLTRERQDRYEKLLAEEYDRAAERWSVESLKMLAAKRRDEVLRDALEHAKERAKKRLISESRQ